MSEAVQAGANPSAANPAATDTLAAKPSGAKTPAAKAQNAAPTSSEAMAGRIVELKVSGHLMTLDAGLFCVFQAGSAPTPESGLPGVRVSLPPGPAGRPDAVSISTFRDDGWLAGGEGAALVRVAQGPAQVLVTVYQARDASAEQAPRLQVLRLSSQGATASQAIGPVSGRSGPQAVGAGAGMQSVPAPADAELVAHVQRTGDASARMGDWVGTRGSRLWIEGFAIAPLRGISPQDIEYQAVLGRGWLSPWVEGGKFCGSRGMALPLLGLRVRLKGQAAKTHDLFSNASFVDGSEVSQVPAGKSCEAESLAALEAFQVVLRPKGAAAPRPEPPAPARARATRAPAASAKKPPAPARKAGRR